MSKRFFRWVAHAVIAAGLSAALPAAGQEIGSAVYVRTDSDRTTVIAPRLRGSVTIEEQTTVGMVYAVDVWTSASIDIMSSASQVPVTEQRDELNASVDHEFTDLTLSIAYRYSVEPDYVSHGVSGGFSYDFADNNAAIALGANASTDTVGRAGDPDFARDSGAAGGRLSFTQVLDRDTVAQAMYELSRIGGYQVSPYRFVPIGGDGLCSSSVTSSGRAALCVPETSPPERLRHALALELRRSLDESLSLGGGYRFYLDDWGIVSHTAHADLSYLPEPETILSVRYRLYLQGAADHYQPRYDAPQAYVTSDKELATLSSHRLGLDVERVFSFETGGSLTTSLALAGLYYAYSDFLPLDSIVAFEVTAALVYTP